jgi:hypothetical protein
MDTKVEEPQKAVLSPRFRLSLKPFVDYLEKQWATDECSEALDGLRTYLIQTITNNFPNEFQLDQHLYDQSKLTELFQLITFSVLPLTRIDQDIPYAFGLPEPLQLFHYSPAFERLMARKVGSPIDIKTQVNHDHKERFAYQMILEKCYGIDLPKKTTYLPFQKEAGGLTLYYRINIDNTFMTPRPEQVLPALEPDWIQFAKGLLPYSELRNPLPLNQFVIEGFAFFSVEDVTETETIQKLREIFTHLQSEPEPVIYDRFERTLRNLSGQPDLQIGIIPFLQVNGRYVHYPDFASRSVFLRHSGSYPNPLDPVALERIVNYISRVGKPTVTPDLAQASGTHLRALYEKRLRSFLFYPIKMGDTLLGILEMGSPHTNALNEDMLQKFEPVIPLVQELLLYLRTQFNLALDRALKQQFTNLQPAVEWKFNQAAWHYLLGKNASSADVTQVRFPKVYPIYGAIDIRNSSVERHKAIQWDLSQQLAAIRAILDNPILPNEGMMPDVLMDKVNYWQKRLSTGLDSDSEVEISLFLTEKIQPYLRHLCNYQPELTELVQPYFNQLDESTGQFSQALLAYDRSVKWLNTTVKDYLGQAEASLQAIYPHYAESIRTDGLEYTLYIGQSIAPDRHFDLDHLQKLYAWQLTSMVEIARLTRRLYPHLPLPLQTTQLILAHSQPVDISFRQDEHRFDVEGSYSIRYEVLKKRIDKAYILNTHERLTKPGTIALVYANHQDVAPYLPLIDPMRDQQVIESTIEQLELEPLQGLVGLKALRLHIRFDS